MRVGLLGRSGTGVCPNLLQRRPGPGSAANKSAGYQRFSFNASARSGPLQQIWTNDAPTGPCTDGGRGDHPAHAPEPPPPGPGCRNVHFALERALLTAYLESKMHISTSAGPTRSHRPGRLLPSAPPRADPGPRTTTPGEKGSVRRAPSPPRAPTTTHHAKREDRRRHVPHPHPQEAGEDQCARVPPAETRPGPGKPLVLTPPSRATAPIPACSSPTITSPATAPAPSRATTPTGSPATVSRVSSPTTPTDSAEPSPLPRLRPVPRAVRPGPDGPWDALPRVDDHSQIFRYPRSPVG